jgi:predicted nucleic acid-binding protein
MSVYVDTSAFLAIMDVADINHDRAKRAWDELVASEEELIASNYVIVETFALAQRRLGLGAVASFEENVYPALEIHWVDEPTHDAGVAAVLAAFRRNLGLVDCVSFAVMRRAEIRKAFSFDPHFKEQGFEIVPGPPG